MSEIALHAEKMDAIYKVQRHFYDLTRKYYLLGRDRLIARLQVPDAGTVLEVGCGTGRNLIAAARAYPNAQFYGLDISEAMLETARKSVAKAGLTHRIQFAQGDATAFHPDRLFGVSGFDRVFLSYTLSMIPDWQAALHCALAARGVSGQVHIVDFGQQEQLPRVFRKLLFGWLSRFDVSPRAALPDVLSRLANADFLPLYRGYAWAAEIR